MYSYLEDIAGEMLYTWKQGNEGPSEITWLKQRQQDGFMISQRGATALGELPSNSWAAAMEYAHIPTLPHQESLLVKTTFKRIMWQEAIN